MSDLVGNPEYRFSHNEAQILSSTVFETNQALQPQKYLGGLKLREILLSFQRKKGTDKPAALLMMCHDLFVYLKHRLITIRCIFDDKEGFVFVLF